MNTGRLLSSGGHWYRFKGNFPFVTRSGSQLMLGGVPLRLAGSNVHWVGLLDTSPHPTWPTHARIDQVMADALAMHHTVVRMVTAGINQGSPNSIEPSLGTFNEAAFDIIDYALSVMAGYGMKAVIPLTADGNFIFGGVSLNYTGSIQTFTDWEGLTAGTASTRDQTYNAFIGSAQTNTTDVRAHMSHIINHINAYTGVAYKDDPTIMLWEIGNELWPPSGWSSTWLSWMDTTAAWIKSIDPNHLVGDSHNNGPTANLTTAQLALGNIDCYTGHFYFQPFSTFTTAMNNAANLAASYGKVYFLGEWDWTSAAGTAAELQSFLAAMEANSNLAWDTFWQLYPTGMSGDSYSLVYPAAAGSDTETRQNYLATHAQTMNSIAGAPGPLTPPVLA